MSAMMTRREMLYLAGAAAAALPLRAQENQGSAMFVSRRPTPQDRRFSSPVVESYIASIVQRIPDPELAWLFANCYPNTLDTTVIPGSFEGKPDTAVITGDIPAMWLRDSSAQVWPYLPLASQDPALRRLLEGVLRRQARCVLIDPYANAFMVDLDALPLEWSRSDATEMKCGVGERKWELDSLCYPIRLAHGYWSATGDTSPFDKTWVAAMRLIVETMRIQQRKHGLGPYHFQRMAKTPTETLPCDGFGTPVRPVGLIASGFRPSDDACTFPFLVPSNLFAVTSLRQLAEMADKILHDSELANGAFALADEVAAALRQNAIVATRAGTIWAYEVDGFGGQLLMDDANVPSLLGLPYIDSSPDPALYARTRSFVWSAANPWFFSGSAGEGIGGPHVGREMIWPMSLILLALTSRRSDEVRRALTLLKQASAGTGFMHESFDCNDVSKFTRPWFAWANTLFGELIGTAVERKIL